MGSMPLTCIIKILPLAKSPVSASVDSGVAAQHGSCPSRLQVIAHALGVMLTRESRRGDAVAVCE